MKLFLIVGVVSGVVGLIFLFAPKSLSKFNDVVNKMLIDVDTALSRVRLGIGISLCLISITMFFMAYYMMQKYGLR